MKWPLVRRSRVESRINTYREWANKADVARARAEDRLAASRPYLYVAEKAIKNAIFVPEQRAYVARVDLSEEVYRDLQRAFR